MDVFTQSIEEKWLEYWNNEGENVILLSWFSKYKDYIQLDPDTEIKEENETKFNNQISDSKDSFELKDFDENWQILWEEHCKEEYITNYELFARKFLEDAKTDNDKKDCEEQEDIQSDSSTGSENNIEDNLRENEIEYLPLNQCNIMLSLGLPASFGDKKLTASINVPKKKLKVVDKISRDKPTQDDYDDKMLLEDPFWNMDVQALKMTKFKKKRKKKHKKNPDMPKSKSLKKYWRRRFSLFSRFNFGINLDDESWFSVTPEKIAANIAKNLKCNIIIDAFCGCGGNTIQFGFTCDRVIAIDIDAKKVEFAKHNAKIYGVHEKIEFIVGDFLQLYKNLKADIVFLSPPWGGPEYTKLAEYDIEINLKPISASELIEKSREITNNIVIYLPKNSITSQIIKAAGVEGNVKIEKNYINNKIVAITACYGNLATSS